MRVSIARALAAQPRLLLMDEPFAALDEPTRQALNDDLIALAREDDITVIFVTHSVTEASYLSDRVLLMRPRPRPHHGRDHFIAAVPTRRGLPPFAGNSPRRQRKVAAALLEIA